MEKYKIKITDLSRFGRDSESGHLTYDGLILLDDSFICRFHDLGDIYLESFDEFLIQVRGDPVVSTDGSCYYAQNTVFSVGGNSMKRSVSKDFKLASEWRCYGKWEPTDSLDTDNTGSWVENEEVFSLAPFAEGQNSLMKALEYNKSFISGTTAIDSIFRIQDDALWLSVRLEKDAVADDNVWNSLYSDFMIRKREQEEQYWLDHG